MYIPAKFNAVLLEVFACPVKTHRINIHTRAVQWKTGKVVLKIACTTDIIVCTVCEGSDLELPIDGVGMPAARIEPGKQFDKMTVP